MCVRAVFSAPCILGETPCLDYARPWPEESFLNCVSRQTGLINLLLAFSVFFTMEVSGGGHIWSLGELRRGAIFIVL